MCACSCVRVQKSNESDSEGETDDEEDLEGMPEKKVKALMEQFQASPKGKAAIMGMEMGSDDSDDSDEEDEDEDEEDERRKPTAVLPKGTCLHISLALPCLLLNEHRPCLCSLGMLSTTSTHR